jgi:hypothetical protein
LNDWLKQDKKHSWFGVNYEEWNNPYKNR